MRPCGVCGCAGPACGHVGAPEAAASGKLRADSRTQPWPAHETHPHRSPYPSVLSAARIQAHYAAGGTTPRQPVPALGIWSLLALGTALAVFGLAWQRRRLG